MTTVRIRAAAKVNPTLHVLARRDDGFHEVDTTLMALELADELELSASESPGAQLTCDGPFGSRRRAPRSIGQRTKRMAVRCRPESGCG